MQKNKNNTLKNKNNFVRGGGFAKQLSLFQQQVFKGVLLLCLLGGAPAIAVDYADSTPAAIRKKEANNLVHSIMQRATVISEQKMNGKNADLSSFSEKAGASTITLLKGQEATTQTFTLQATTVSKKECEEINKLTWPITMVEPTICAETNTMTFAFRNDLIQPSAPADVGVCENGNVYLSYNVGAECDTETPMNAQSCTSGSDCWSGMGDANCCDAETKTCKVGTYEKGRHYVCIVENKKQCIKNSDCDFGEYCKLASSTWNSYQPNTGTCTPLGGYTDAVVVELGLVRRSNNPMTWWAAENWCKAQNRALIDVSKFQAYNTTKDAKTSELISAGQRGGYGCAKDKKCGYWNQSPYSAMWSGNTLVETAGDEDGFYKDRYSPVLISLREQFDSDLLFFWTASNCGDGEYSMLGIDLSYGSIGYRDRDNDFVSWSNVYHYALCE